MVEQGEKCDPTEDAEFLTAVADVFRRFPEVAGKYALTTDAALVASPQGSSRGVEIGRESLVLEAFDEEPPPGASHCFLYGRDPETGVQQCEIWWYQF